MVNISIKGKTLLIIVGVVLLLPTIYTQNILFYDALLSGNSTLIHSTFRDNISLTLATVSVFIAFVLFILTVETQDLTNRTIELTMDANKNTQESLKLTQETLALIKSEIKKNNGLEKK